MNYKSLIKNKYGIRLWFVLFVILGSFLIPAGIMIYFDWSVSEQVLNSMTCEELLFSIKNKEHESQMIWHYNDRCL